jgi:aspartyl/asparaginyl beta-hydroxylase (cupin superfamily)
MAPADPRVPMTRALIHRVRGEFAAAVGALDDALELDPYNFLALLSKGAILEQSGGPKAAAAVYKNAIKIAPAADELPPGLTAPLARARDVVARQEAALHAHLLKRVGEVRGRFPGERLGRFDEALEIFSGRSRPYVQEPLLLHYPRLPAIPFYDEDLFPWLAELEAATPVIQEELAGAMEKGSHAFAPYIAYPKGAPVNQWGELNHSRRWSSFFLWRDGRRQDEACALCPRTAALLESLPMARQPNFAPTAMFSALEAGTHIPPHTGSANTRLLVHLPLILPGPARFRVGAETREWEIGRAWVFDDTIEHEAWNDAEELRVILIFDIWNPLLSEAERELITAMMAAKNEFMSA